MKARTALGRIRGAGRLHGINHVGVTVTDFDEAVAWYARMFDFHLVNELIIEGEKARELAPLYGRDDLRIRLGFLGSQSSGLLEIFEFTPKVEPAPTVWNRPGFTHVAISVSNVPAVKGRLESLGVEFVTDIQFTGGAHWAFMKDLDGNLVEIIDYHANRLPLALASNLVGKILAKRQFGHIYM